MPKQGIKILRLPLIVGQTFEALLDFNWTAEAVTNVLDNAVKYTPSGGVVDLKITEYPSYLRLDVSDNGIGIPEEEQAKKSSADFTVESSQQELTVWESVYILP